MIHVESMTKRFGKVVAVNNVSFDVRDGEALALWGHNGAGKTTILRCLLGVTPFEGSAHVGGVAVRRNGRLARTRVGFVPQDVFFYQHLSVNETLALFRRIRGLSPLRSAELVGQLQLEEYQDKRVRELSGGVRQRLALAVALLSNPPILFMDEPTSNLDKSSREKFFSFLAAQKEKGTTIVFSSHRMEEVSSLADRVLVLEAGRIVSEYSLTAKTKAPMQMMQVFVDPGRIGEAIETLTRDGFEASRNGHSLWVRVSPGEKGRPIACLLRSDIHVRDFDLSSRKTEAPE